MIIMNNKNRNDNSINDSNNSINININDNNISEPLGPPAAAGVVPTLEANSVHYSQLSKARSRKMGPDPGRFELSKGILKWTFWDNLSCPNLRNRVEVPTKKGDPTLLEHLRSRV